MKYTLVAFLLAASVAAQTIDQLVEEIPTCAVTCIRDGAQKVNCDVTDFTCSCAKVGELTSSVVPCLATSGCSSSDQAKVLQIATQICAKVGEGGQVSAAATSGAATSGTATTTSARTATEASAVTSTTAPSAADRLQAAGWAGAIAAAAAFAL
ncbi:hypothetical protein CTA1_9709 [Colletotrichum tanaceti]|uniref:CFEM domain-containing protein n=1 Tax=Colletotrichum tanaceti TaxID=1306861 RepID=A0A4U6XF12_9PEZI|nr:hypothetical protein CTA1_9709 [Colletotrichum tanaceti]